ncbi:serine hydrolase domain-containing protein [Levilactobacillus humaensis]|uniref:serine hydrolase domain-containing protein n=1 Tax=Levilactobacillus humaensis TaxID=2950375 RepID=UPI0021C2DC01|nr:serine hydrolase domain-containing protein [Levilactobacillus humaensis]
MNSKVWGTVLALGAVLGLGGGLAWWFNGQTQQTKAEPKVSSSSVVRKVKPKKKVPAKKRKLAPAATTRQIDAVLQANRFVGTALVVHHNQTIYQQGWGYADAANRQKNHVNSVYQLASIQKSFTAGLLMKLASENKVALSDPLSKYYPQIAGSNQITLREMLDMKSGLVLTAFPNSIRTEQQMIKFILNNVVSQPAKIGRWHYSPVNFMLLAGIIQKVSGESYQDYFTKNIIDAGNLQHSGFVFNMANRSDYSQGYTNSKTGSVLPTYDTEYGESKLSMLYQFGTGQVYMSVNDLFQAERNMLLGKVYPQKDVNVLLVPGSASMYGGGLYVYPTYVRGHGLAYGYEATFLLSKDGQDGVVLLSNYYRANQLSQTAAIQLWNLLEGGNLGK